MKRKLATVKLTNKIRISQPSKMKLFHVTIILLSCVTHVISQLQCPGTCYSGSFPKNNQVIKGKLIRGYSYKNITTDDPHMCFSSCVNDCRCKAFQMKDVRCELLDEDKTSKAADFVDETGYVYYDLQQTFFKGKSHMVHAASVCYNGCCRTQSCMNGGTCVEHCEKPKVKFSCKCPETYFGRVCESKIGHSCMDVLRKSLLHGILPANGIYNIIHKDTEEILPRYCAFVGFPHQAWTLIESFAFGNNDFFEKKVFYQNKPVNELKPNWNKYRLSLRNMQYTRTNATLYRATCEFPRRNISLAPDFLLGNLSDYDPLYAVDTKGVCIKVAYVNIKGEECYNCTVPAFQKKYSHHLHLDFRVPECEFAPDKQKHYEDNFGYYRVISPGSLCTATMNSTTQWWLGEQQ